VTLRLDLARAPGLPAVLADRTQLQQVIMNLLVNGIQAMSVFDAHLRELVVRSRRHEGELLLVEVQDGGVRIPPDNLHQPLNAFFTTGPNGMGMGLSICRSIIEAHGGRIWAESNGDARATFRFSLPISREAGGP
jgi:two-component system sensor kinase FixL